MNNDIYLPTTTSIFKIFENKMKNYYIYPVQKLNLVESEEKFMH